MRAVSSILSSTLLPGRAVILAVLLMLLWPDIGAAASAGPTEQDLTRTMLQLHERILHRTRIAQLNASDRGIDGDGLRADVERFERDLLLLEHHMAGSASAADTETLTRKVQALRGLIANLRLAADTGVDEALGVAVDYQEAQPVDRVSAAESSAPPANDACATATEVVFDTYTGTTDQSGNDGTATCGSSFFSPDVWFRFTAVEHERVVVDTVGSSFDTVLSVHRDCPGTISNQITCNDDASGLFASVSFTALPGNDYLIRLGGANGATGSYLLSVTRGGEISGKVTESQTGDPVASAVVSIYNDAGSLTRSEYTDAAGDYVVTGLSSGTFHAIASRQPFVTSIYDGISCSPSGECDPTTGDPIAVTAGSSTAGIDFALIKSGSITGTLRDLETADPVALAGVTVYDSTGVAVITRTYSEQSGFYRIDGLLAGTYHLVATHSLYRGQLYDSLDCPGGAPTGCDPSTGTPVVVELDAVTDGIDFDLQAFASISGQVTATATGDPLPDATINVYHPTGIRAGYAWAESDGTWTVGGLQDGTYYAVAEEWDHVDQLWDGIDCTSACDLPTGTPIVISDQTDVSGIDFSLTERGRISGTVVDSVSGLPEQSVDLRIYATSGYVVDFAHTQADGTYTSNGLTAGTHYVRTNDADYLNELWDDIPCEASCEPLTGTPVEVSNGAITSGIDFALMKKGGISGTAHDRNNGDPLFLRIEVFAADGSFVKATYSSGDCGDGQYEITGLDSGTYYVVTDAFYNGWIDRLWDDIVCWKGSGQGCDPTTGTPVVVTLGTITPEINFQVERAGSISGTVTETNTGLALDSRVVALTPAGEEVSSARTFTVHSGYVLDDLLPGEYLVVADASSHRDEVYDDLPCVEYPSDCDLSSGTLVSVAVGTTTSGIDLVLDSFGTISGRIVDSSNNAPLRSVNVEAFDGTGAKVGAASSDSNGHYTLHGLLPGTYFVATNTHSADYHDQLYNQVPCSGGPGIGCTVTTGTPIMIDINSHITAVDFALPISGAISGRVTDERTGEPIAGRVVSAWTAAGISGSDQTDLNGAYTISGLQAGSYFVATDYYSHHPVYVDELYDDIPCWQGPPQGCDPTKGKPVMVSSGAVTRFIDFALTPWQTGIEGSVTGSASQAPLSGVTIDLWSADTGEYISSVFSDAEGAFVTTLDAGSYLLSTDNNQGWQNQIWQSIKCGGSAFDGGCDVMQGTPVEVFDSLMTTGIDFELEPAVVFAEGFESGDTTAWSAAYP